MQDDFQELQRLREKVAIARTDALRLGHTRLAALLEKSVIGIDLVIAELDEIDARTRPQVEALKRLIGAT